MTITTPARELFAANHAKNQTLAHAYGRTRAVPSPIKPIDLPVDTRVRFFGDHRWWVVRATDGDRVVLTRGGDFGRGPRHTIIVWSEGRRGPHDSWGYPVVTREDCEAVVAAMASTTATGYRLALSERRAIYLDLERYELPPAADRPAA